MLQANKLGALGILLNDAIAGEFGNLSPSAAALLLTLRYRGETTVTTLAAIGGIAQPTASRVTAGLIRGGLVERRERAGRTAPVRLTKAGARLANTIQRARLGAMNSILGVLTKAERAVFERALDKMLGASTPSRTFARITCRLCDHTICDGPLCPIGTRATAIERGIQRPTTGRKQ